MKILGKYCTVPTGEKPSHEREHEMSDRVIIYGKAG